MKKIVVYRYNFLNNQSLNYYINLLKKLGYKVIVK